MGSQRRVGLSCVVTPSIHGSMTNPLLSKKHVDGRVGRGNLPQRRALQGAKATQA